MYKFVIVLLSIMTFGCVMGQFPCDLDPAVYCRLCMDKRNQLDYYYNPCNCQSFFHCQPLDNNGMKSTLVDCGVGFKFDNSSLQCIPLPFGQTCDWNDPCLTDLAIQEQGKWGPDSVYCGLFYSCSNYYSIQQCCPDLTAFNAATLECDSASFLACTTLNTHASLDRCSGGMTVPMPAPIAVTSDICFDPRNLVWRGIVTGFTDRFYQYTLTASNTVPPTTPPSDGWVIMKCGEGSNFNFTTCKCTDFGLVSPPPPEPCLIELSCNGPEAVDTSPHHTHIDFPGPFSGQPLFGQPSCEFVGSNWLESPFMAGNQLQNRFTIAFEFAYSCGDNVPAGSPVPVLNNRGKTDLILSQTLTSIRFEMTAANVLSVSVLLKYTPLQVLSVPTTCNAPGQNEWNHIWLTYDGSILRLVSELASAGQPSQTVSFVPVPKPNVDLYWMLHCPWVVADDWTLPTRYVGAFDGLYICRQVKTDPQIRTFLN